MRLSLWFIVLALVGAPIQAATMSFTCSFPNVASPSGVKKESKPLELRFVSDPQAKKTYMLGNNGSAEVTSVGNSSGGVTFVEVTESGNVMVTAISTSGEAVHSRNGIISGKLIPSQYYGKCEIQ
jgi:hypothetical protein